MNSQIDKVDRHIVYQLEANARAMSASDIADGLDVSARTVRNRIHRLEDKGIIRGYHADVDYERIDNRITNLFMCTVPIPEREQLAQQALEVPGIVNVRELTTGRRNLHAVAVARDTADITRIARDLSALGIDIEDEALIQQEGFHPYHEFGPDDGSHGRHPGTVRQADADLEVVDVSVSETAPVVGQSLAELRAEGHLREDVLIVAIERGESTVTPTGDTTIQAGDEVTLFSRERMPRETISALTGSETESCS